MVSGRSPYNAIRSELEGGTVRRKTARPAEAETFGGRLARLRRAAGHTQRSFAAEVGISDRMVAYYESQGGNPPASLLPLLAGALRVSADALLGIAPPSERQTPRAGPLWKRFRAIQELPLRERRTLIGVIDAFLERDQMKRSAQ